MDRNVARVQHSYIREAPQPRTIAGFTEFHPNPFMFLCFAFLLGLLVIVPAVAAEGLDVVTMKNGDIYNGTVAESHFVVKTPYGQVNVPYGTMAKLEFAGSGKDVRLYTQFGDRFSGELQQNDFKMLRTLGTVLPLNAGEIRAISFSAKPYRRKHVAPDVIHARNGDLFLGKVISAGLEIETLQSKRQISFSDLYMLDSEYDPDEEISTVQATFNNGEKLIGELSTPQLKLQNRYGNTLEISLADLQSVASGVSYMINDQPQRVYQQHTRSSHMMQDSLRNRSPAPVLMVLRGGEFERGNLQGEGDGDEQPPQKVSLKPFAIGIYEVTFAEYDRFVDAGSVDSPDDGGWGRDTRPVVNVSWEEAKAFTNWLSSQTGQVYRLPTDAEWEFAARAGTRTKYWWGEDTGTGMANCEGCGSLWDGAKSSPVGRFAPNAYGLFDTAGNVFEWVEDCWHDRFADAPADGSPIVKDDCGKRVIRGGAWSFPDKEIRSANRWRDFPSRRSDDTGFRVVRELAN